MAKKGSTAKALADPATAPPSAGPPTAARRLPSARSSALLDTRVVYSGDNLEQLAKLPDTCVDVINIDPPFSSKSNYEVYWCETKAAI